MMFEWWTLLFGHWQQEMLYNCAIKGERKKYKYKCWRTSFLLWAIIYRDYNVNVNLYLLSEYFRICVVLTHQNLNWVAYIWSKTLLLWHSELRALKNQIYVFFAIHDRYLWCMRKIGNISANVALEGVYVASLSSQSKDWLVHSSKLELWRSTISREKNDWDLMVCS